MKQKEIASDERILGLPTVHDWRIVYKREIYGAFDITEQGLLSLESCLHNNIIQTTKNSIVSEGVKVVFSGKPSEMYNKISEVINLRNPRKGRVTGINIRVSTDACFSSIWIDDTGLYSSHSIVLLFASNSDTEFRKLEISIDDELANLEFRYSIIRKSLDRLLSLLGKIPPVIYNAIFYIGLAITLFSLFLERSKYISWRKAAESVIKEYDKLSNNVDQNITAQINSIKSNLEQHNNWLTSSVLSWIYGASITFLVFLCLIFLSYLFPRVIFEIGEGKKRYEHILWLRRFVIGSIIICGIIIPIIFKKFIKLY